MAADVKTARCDEIADLTEYKEYVAEVVGVELEVLFHSVFSVSRTSVASGR
jgi:phytoene/squalene synthetase